MKSQLVIFKCSKCEHTSEQYASVKEMYHQNCPNRGKSKNWVPMVLAK